VSTAAVICASSGGGRRRTKPTRAELLNVQASFCSHMVTLDDYGTIPLFDPFIASMNPAQRQQCYKRKRELGITHIVLSAHYAYPYPVPGHNWRDDLQGLRAIVEEAIAEGFMIALTVTDGGQEDYAYWTLERLQQAAQIFAGLDAWCIDAILWEVIGPGGDWTPDQVQAMCRLHRQAFGDAWQIGIEFGQGYCHLGNAADDWYQAGLDTIDIFFYESAQPTFVAEQMDKNLDVYARMLGPAARNIPPENLGPWYVGQARARGPLVFCQFENIAYTYIRGESSDSDVRIEADWFKSHGATVFGNGLPSTGA
jgi:hypothetical protein